MMNTAVNCIKLICFAALSVGICIGQSVTELQNLVVPEDLDISPDGSQLWFRLGDSWWHVDTAPDSHPKRIDDHHTPRVENLLEIQGTSRFSSPRKSPDGRRIACLDAERPYGPELLFSRTADPRESSKARPLSRMPILAFQWASDSRSLWVIGTSGADEPIGRMSLDGHFEPVSQTAALRSLDDLVAGDDVLAWVQSDSVHHGAIWVRNRNGESRMLVDPNPQTSAWSAEWTQEVVRWKNAHGEELQGILARPRYGSHLPLLVDPYSSRRNRFLNISALGNYVFVKAGFAVFQPDHRAPYSFPEMAFGEAYVGAAKDRDPVDVLTDDVMSGVGELIHRGIADPQQLFLYSASNGASAIDQLLTQTHAFRAAVSYGGVSDWLGYYEVRHQLGDETIPGFLGGRTPQDSLALYQRISPVYQADKITTPLLVIGDKDTRYSDTMRFYDVLRKLHCPVSLVVYHGEGHELSSEPREQEHVQRSLDFLRSAKPVEAPSQ
jgi:hypothetical protein